MLISNFLFYLILILFDSNKCTFRYFSHFLSFFIGIFSFSYKAYSICFAVLLLYAFQKALMLFCYNFSFLCMRSTIISLSNFENTLITLSFLFECPLPIPWFCSEYESSHLFKQFLCGAYSIYRRTTKPF